MTANRVLTIGAVLSAVLAVVIGLLSGPRRLVRLGRQMTGFVPALSPKPWGYTLERLERMDLRGQSALVTGANSGIGFETARALSRQGAAVTLACRNPRRCSSAADRIREEEGHSGGPVRTLVVDLSDLKSVQRAAEAMGNGTTLDMLFLNAGILGDRHERGATSLPLSADGIEKVFATNVVGHHLLYRLLEPALKKSTMARVVLTSSVAGLWWRPHKLGEGSPLAPATLGELNRGRPSGTATAFALYGRSKLAQVAWSGALTRRLGEGSTIYVNAAHPGAVFTKFAQGELFSDMPDFVLDAINYISERLLWPSREGALTGLYLGVASEELREVDVRGRYFHPQAVEFDHPYGGDRELQENVWNLCEELVKDFV